ncbi:MAG: PH domain-containing protein [Terracidiphilus sp.]|jgi:hypothetical protein
MIACLLIVSLLTKSAVIGALGLGVIVLTYLFSPRSYQITDRFLLVKRWVGNVRVPLESIHELRLATADDIRASIRLWASYGLFGYYGLFKTAQLGRCKWYMRNREKPVILVTGNGTLLLGPDDALGFLAAVRSSVSIPKSNHEESGTMSNVPSASLGILFGAFFAILVVGVVCVALLYSPGPPKWTLSSNTLTIQDRFYPVKVNAADTDVSGIRIVNIQTDAEWKPTARINGFGNPHYHSGWFRIAGGPARMYWAEGARLILLPPRQSGSPVLLQVDDPEQFVQTIRQRWAGQ